MTRVTARRFAGGIVILWALHAPRVLGAQLEIGTWVRKPVAGDPAGTLTMTIEACCRGGRRLIYRITGSSDMLMTVETPMDGTDVPVIAAGKPSGETMGIKRVDALHAVTVLKMNGKTFGTSKATLSADGKTLTVENDYTSAIGNQPVGKQMETWVRK